MGRLLGEINVKTALRLVSLTGGEKDNAIAKASTCTIAFNESDRNAVLETVRHFSKLNYENTAAPTPTLR